MGLQTRVLNFQWTLGFENFHKRRFSFSTSRGTLRHQFSSNFLMKTAKVSSEFELFVAKILNLQNFKISNFISFSTEVVSSQSPNNGIQPQYEAGVIMEDSEPYFKQKVRLRTKRDFWKFHNDKTNIWTHLKFYWLRKKKDRKEVNTCGIFKQIDLSLFDSSNLLQNSSCAEHVWQINVCWSWRSTLCLIEKQ